MAATTRLTRCLRAALIGLIGSSGLLALGCTEPAEALAAHFEAMALIAEERDEDCAEAAAQLTRYLDAHREPMAEAAAQLGESSQAQARRIHVASQRLDKVVEGCRSEPGMTRFAEALSKLVLGATGLEGEPQPGR